MAAGRNVQGFMGRSTVANAKPMGSRWPSRKKSRMEPGGARGQVYPALFQDHVCRLPGSILEGEAEDAETQIVGHVESLIGHGGLGGPAELGA